MSRGSWLKALALAVALVGLEGASRPRAQDWTDYLHWPYVPPQVPGNGFEYNGLYDGWYLYPREQRIVPQIQGPYYRNFYGGYRVLGCPPPARLATTGTRRSSTRATTSSSTSSEYPAASTGARPTLAARSAFQGGSLLEALPQGAGDLVIRSAAMANLVELDPLVLGVGLGDVARPEDEAGQPRCSERAGVGPVGDARDLGPSSPMAAAIAAWHSGPDPRCERPGQAPAC